MRKAADAVISIDVLGRVPGSYPHDIALFNSGLVLVYAPEHTSKLELVGWGLIWR